jgi:hypothetical protein
MVFVVPVLCLECLRLKTEKLVNLDEEVDILYAQKDLDKLENASDMDEDELDQIIVDTM